MRVGLVPGSFKPYHAGHDTLVRRAAAENDVVLVVYSTASRSRKGEAAISGDASSKIMTEFVAPTLPSNVKLISAGTPVRRVYEHIISEEERYIREGKCDLLTVYTDADDIANFKNLERYAPVMTARGQIKFSTMTRGSDSPQISGTAMRAAALRGDVTTFTEGLPRALRPHAREILATLGFTASNGPNALMLRAPAALIETARSTRSSVQVIYERSDASRRRRDLLNELYLSCLLYERQLIVEDTGSYDSWTTSPNLLVKTFVAPFANAAKAVGVGALDVANVAKVPLKAIYYKLKGSDAPFQQAMADYRRSKKKIDELWKPITKYSDEALSNDAQLLAFALAPKEYVGLALGKTFKQALVGKEGDDSTGLIGTLAATGFLPDEWADKWKDFKSGRNKDDEDDERVRQRQKEREEARNRLQSNLEKILTLLGFASFADFEGRDEAIEKIKSLQEKLKRKKTAEISEKELGSVDSWSGESGVLSRIYDALPKKSNHEFSREKYNNILRRIGEDIRTVAESRSSSSFREYSKLDVNTSQIAQGTFFASYKNLGSAFKEYAKCALFYAALAKSTDLESLDREVKTLKIDISGEIEELKERIVKAAKDAPKEQQAAAYKTAVEGAKLAVAKGISERQGKVIDLIQKVTKETLGEVGSPPHKTIMATDEGKDFKRVVDAAKKAMTEIHDSMRKPDFTAERAAKAIKDVLAVIAKKTGESG